LTELSFWEKNCRLLNLERSTISTMTVNTVFDRVILCDASDVGFGCFANSDLDSHLENIETFGNWTESESL
jgi:hypothetical protein